MRPLHESSRALVVPLGLLGLLFFARVVPGGSAVADDASEARWWKGNTHTHTLWSDGDAPPDFVAKQYKDAGYHFLVFSDHNVLSRSERWFPVEAEGRLTEARLESLLGSMGTDVLETRTNADGGRAMRLPTLEEVQSRFAEEERFLLIEGEEITDSFEGRPVHVNGLNLGELVRPRGGTSFLETVQRNVDAVREQGERLGRTTLAHLNHPNFGWAVRGTSDLVGLRGPAFLEVYNGHPSTREAGDDDHLSVETLWDEVNVGRALIGLPLALGFATDDSHHHWSVSPDRASMGRGWVMVRAATLETEAVMRALAAGDFYASSGVTLEDVRFGDGEYVVDVDARPETEYETTFLGGVRDEADQWVVQVLHQTAADPAVYTIRGDELFVRATVTSSRLHPRPQNDPPGTEEREMAWTQPVALKD